ncbi:MAG: hypothetical protein FJY66_02375 [Calditrichaeota bacterium]|nr:hypothetical protein [Calditrichota bacterium]
MTRISAVCLLVFLLGSGTVWAYDDARKYGMELRGGFSLYQVSDTRDVLDYYGSSSGAKVTESYSGPSGGFSLLWRQEKYFQWNIGYNALLDFESEAKWNDTTLTLSGRATEIFALGNFVFPVFKSVRLYAGGGVTYLVAKQDILWQPGNSIFDGTGRALGVIANGSVEIFLGRRLGLNLGGGYRVANVTEMTDVDYSGARSKVVHPLANRAWEADFSGPYMVTGLRIYFDPVTKPIDFGE